VKITPEHPAEPAVSPDGRGPLSSLSPTARGGGRAPRRDTSDADIALLKRDAAEQLRRYADDGKVARTKGNTRLGLITLVFKGWELVALEKLASRADCENESEA